MGRGPCPPRSQMGPRRRAQMNTTYNAKQNKVSPKKKAEQRGLLKERGGISYDRGSSKALENYFPLS